ncbi:MAG: 2-C-methyl-D-erythritol 4-phosphate cytidylyltransferase, partial [Dehalococcoidia bacterium]|nr:2-C-methyl-D-erythritol 4-phosphate cytidylyltransferase [Dehalococcoidia bacterium]
PQLIEFGLTEALKTGSAIAAVSVTDTIKTVGPDGIVTDTPQRSNLWSVQTPQIFRLDIIQAAYTRIQEEVTDDASMVEKMGYSVKIFMGAYENIKITNPQDLATAEWILERRKRGS